MKSIKYYLIYFYLYTILLTFIDGLGDMTEKGQFWKNKTILKKVNYSYIDYLR